MFVQSVQTLLYSADSFIYVYCIHICFSPSDPETISRPYPIFAYSSQFSSQCASFLVLFFDPSY